MRRDLPTSIVLAALVAALVLPAAPAAGEGAIGGLVEGVAGQLDVRGGGKGSVGSMRDRLSPADSERMERGAEKVAENAAKAASPADRSGVVPARRTPVASAAAGASVEIADFLYKPETITVSIGDSVTWTNADQAPHDADAFDGSFNTEVLDEGESASVTFGEAGSFRYFCSVHPPDQFPEFTGTVEVVSAGGGSNGSSAGGGSGSGGSADTTGGGTAGGADTGVSSTDAGGSPNTAGAGTANPGAESAAHGADKSGLAETGLDLLPFAALGAWLLASGLLLRPGRRHS